ncbi:class I SAM-dependent methyltransferase, partial [Patescibacteria group bacterium]|nr:class I SAM-dependent methyltransferase [Patescibacteria group bacterium]
GQESIWGKESPLTLKVLQSALGNGGKWLHLAAGDGRYNNEIACSADKVFATDIDNSALRKLHRNTPKDLINKVETFQQNLIEKFPLKTSTIDGVFSAGTLHLFPESIFNDIASEISRVLKVGGVMVLEFRVDIKRTNTQTGELIKFGDEPLYNRDQAIAAITKAFPNFNIQFADGDQVSETFDKANPPLRFSCNNLLVTATKQRNIE